MPSYITNAQLAQQVSDLLAKWQTRETQMQAWIGGTATGGPFADGTYPLTDVLSNTVYTPSPAALVSGVGVSVAGAAAQAAAAAASATAAAGSATTATTQAGIATTKATAAAASNTSAAAHDTNCASLQALAQTSANNALASQIAAAASASAAAGSASAAATSASNAAASATAAAASAVSAAASAVLAATFVPALYALLAGAIFTGTVQAPTLTSTGDANVAGALTVGSTVASDDIHTVRVSAPTTGVIYLGNSLGRYLYYDGTEYVMPNANLILNGNTISGTNTGDQNLAPYALLAGATFTGRVIGVGSAIQLVSKTTVARGGGSNWIDFQDSTGESGYLGFGGAGNNFNVQNILNGSLTLGTNNAVNLTITAAGAATFAGTVAASNLSGTNTGDQNLAPYALLAGATFTGGVGIGVAPDSALYVLGANGCSLRVDYGGGPGNNYYDATTHNFRNTAGALRAQIIGGLVMAGATGGDQGSGTVNATQYYKNGVALSSGATTGTFTGTLTGFGSATTGTFTYVTDGQSVTIYAKAAILGTSNATTMTLTGVPSIIQPVALTRGLVSTLTDNTSSTLMSQFQTAASSGTISLFFGVPGSLGSFTASGTKGFPAGAQFTYPLA